MPNDAAPIVARAHAAACALSIGETAYVDGISIRRTTLLTYRVAGFSVDLDEVAAEVAYLSAEREAIRMEPSLRRAGELVPEPRGTFVVRLERIVLGERFWGATWRSEDWRSSPRDERAVLEDLTGRARELGMAAEHVGYKVVASVPALRMRPGLARAFPAVPRHRERQAA